MLGIWRSVFDRSCRKRLLDRLRGLDPQVQARWGRMSAPQMVTHLIDQMHHALGDSPVAPRPGPLRWAPVRFASIYLLPWPRARIQAPPEALATRPTTWDADVAELIALVERLAARGPEGDWPDHARFGRMTGRAWGVFCHRHLDHHLRQFGA